MFGDICYEIDPRALKSGVLLGRWSEVPTSSSAAVTVTATSTPTPGGRIRVLQDWSVYALGGGGQTSAAMRFDIIGPGGNMFTFRTTYTAAVSGLVNINKTLNWILLPGEYVAAAVTFSAGVAANQVDLNLIGYEIPRGNIS